MLTVASSKLLASTLPSGYTFVVYSSSTELDLGATVASAPEAQLPDLSHHAPTASIVNLILLLH